ncbi:MAG: hypothetical protein BWX79_02464 [Alphaproteobacteria bacterium ADurb.Bin100]|nr:MAG: hypothetical protein BWX79_02464 [Alphaproteobacteria bacterium ADurb.Bin100]
MGLMPRARSAASAACAPGLGSSPKAINARSTSPSVVRSAMADTVAPCCCSSVARAASGLSATPSSSIQRRLPIRKLRPSTSPSLPRPGTARTLSGAPNVISLAFAAATTARASGCSLPLCRLAAAIRSSASSAPSTGTSAVRIGRPSVRVPVLSKATMSTLCASSSACASLIRMPYLAATPVPAMMAAGVASPSAHGHAITSTATAWITAVSNGAPAHHSQVNKVTSDTTSTTGTNTAATWSTRRWIGALAACASSTSRMMRDNTVSLPTAVTCSTTRPSPLIEPPVNLSPGSRGTGSGSPVSMDSSTCVWPSSSAPSTGKRSPGLTTMRSPTITSATGTSISPSRPIRCATSGRSACSARIAVVVWRLARASRNLPSSTSVTTTAEPSKYRCGEVPGAAVSQSHIDSAQPAVVPIATSRSMLPVRASSACQPAL